MAFIVPTTQELKATNIATLEASLAQTSPAADKSFTKVLGAVEALNHAQLYRFALDKIKGNLAITGGWDDLLILGAEYGLTPTPAMAAILTATVTGTSGLYVPATIPFVGDINGLLYFPTSTVLVAGGVATLQLSCSTSGSIGNMAISDTLTIGSIVAGIGTTATVTAITSLGTDLEDIEVFRQRILFAIQASIGAGNAAQYKAWGEAVSGVQAIYPYAGFFDADTHVQTDDSPPSRTVFVECTTDLDPDGIPDSSLLNLVKAALTLDPDTLTGRLPLGLDSDTAVNSYLAVSPIMRSSFTITISGINISDTPTRVLASADLDAALTAYFIGLAPFLTGIDNPLYRADTITATSIGRIVADTLAAYGATATAITFKRGSGSVITSYLLLAGELAAYNAAGSVYNFI
jgi:hypothetical protein